MLHPRALDRLLAVVPDVVSALAFAGLWLSPLAFGPSGVRNAMLVMLVEFVLIHASAFLGAAAFAEGATKLRKVAMLGGFALLYLGFIAAFASAFDATWPFIAFGWLLLGKLRVIFHRAGPDGTSGGFAAMWALSALAYLAAVFATMLLPLPRLGLGEAVRPLLDLPGSGLWVDQPHRVVAAGMLYFGLLAWAKWHALRVQAR
ncbi:MAG: hypothetical protein EOP90_13300 [Lysobacteraceae bacterium]|nr:MAG: hypothetical protein EOP90_13300 [Xanthomonadaceae bacterium]